MADNTTTEVITGGAVLALALGFFAYATQTAGLGGTAGAYELTASFRSVEGVTVGTDVRLAGVKVGTVTALDLNPQTFRADARFTVDEGIELPDDSAVLVSSEGLLGGTFVEILPGGSPFNLSPGDEVLDTQGAVSLISLLMKVFTATGEEGAE
ncbi:outer membrane lipid asymmetry maintenance protein MlaD [Rhodovulum euryhalinum]|uniref:Phospholipid/cholesterol/gamma-HCH transport system substrate-binding protein n=1 Tax=Rhodovulum euryhalinum TaxID=35805 RepID=A0A4R2KUA9_9RHOB|nr:outer membrane lipid asymmetry maintenance protein MlaD [Rhodovulum euryhalinum]TCO70305.1 phospholipid/cholesterol/gamma-HCH transport system substrate-binding protein [Rhodovulum euryhalinum]